MRKSELRSENKRLRHREAALMSMNANLRRQVLTLIDAVNMALSGPIAKRRSAQAKTVLQAALGDVEQLQREDWSKDAYTDTFKKESP